MFTKGAKCIKILEESGISRAGIRTFQSLELISLTSFAEGVIALKLKHGKGQNVHHKFVKIKQDDKLT